MSDVPPTNLVGKMAATTADDRMEGAGVFSEDPFQQNSSPTTPIRTSGVSLERRTFPSGQDFPGSRSGLMRNMRYRRINRADSLGSPRMDSESHPNAPSTESLLHLPSVDDSSENSLHMHSLSSNSVCKIPEGFDILAFYEGIPGVTASIQERRNSMLYFDGVFCEPITYAHLAETSLFTSPDNIDDSFPPKLILNVFQTPSHLSNGGTEYVVGYDLGEQELFLAIFSGLPEDLRDFCLGWDEQKIIYSLKIRHFREILSEGPKAIHGELGVSVLGGSEYTDPVIEMIFILLCGQWLIDFAEYIYWSKTSDEVEQVKAQFTDLLSMWNTALIVGSQRAGDADTLMQNDQHSVQNPPSLAYYSLKDVLRHMMNMVENYPFVETDEIRMSAVKLAEEIVAILKDNH
jgi:hypothetical protein